MSGDRAPTVIQTQLDLQRVAAEIGMASDYFNPVFEFTIASLLAIPRPRRTDVGIVDGTTGEGSDPVCEVRPTFDR